ncbi:MAG: hypothetical protein WC595_04665, partial [Candidatus Nanoarchaeia archaeon]
ITNQEAHHAKKNILSESPLRSHQAEEARLRRRDPSGLGSVKLSFVWQSGSSNPFQGYWFPQFIQDNLGIFTHKKSRSLTYVTLSKSSNKWSFRTNASSFSPVYAKFLEMHKIIERNKDTPTTSYNKNLPSPLIKNLSDKEALFQGIMDGDGSYNMPDNNGFYISLAMDPLVNYEFIKKLPLIPTTLINKNKEYKKLDPSDEFFGYGMRFAPSSLSSLSAGFSASDIIKSLSFMIKAAENSIRPDKVHELIAIINRISSKDYGEYKNCLPIQKEIRELAIKHKLRIEVKNLEKRYPLLKDNYQPFIPRWTEDLISKRRWKQDMWEFFINGNHLVKGNYPHPKLLDFSNGVPVDFNINN